MRCARRAGLDIRPDRDRGAAAQARGSTPSRCLAGARSSMSPGATASVWRRGRDRIERAAARSGIPHEQHEPRAEQRGAEHRRTRESSLQEHVQDLRKSEPEPQWLRERPRAREPNRLVLREIAQSVEARAETNGRPGYTDAERENNRAA